MRLGPHALASDEAQLQLSSTNCLIHNQTLDIKASLGDVKESLLHSLAPPDLRVAAERERLRASDPGVDGSPTSIVDSHFVRDLLANGAKPAPFAPAAEPERAVQRWLRMSAAPPGAHPARGNRPSPTT